MNLTDIDNIKKLCKQNNIRLQESRGQNFLVSREILDKIVKAADLKKDDIVLEVGPGFGVLTIELAKRVKKVIAVEIDKKIVSILRSNVKNYKNVEIVENDILKVQGTSRLSSRQARYKVQNFNYKIVANLPYNITSKFLRKFLSNEPKPKEMILMVQKEVAERICAKPRSTSSGQAGKMSLLSVSVQFYTQPKILFNVAKENFWPEPEVDSAVIKIVANGKWQIANGKLSEKDFFKVVRIGFSARRKQLQNNLATGLRLENQKVKVILEKLGFDPKVRAQELLVEEWIELAEQLID